MPVKELLSLLGMFLAIYCLIPYYKGIFARTNKPHIYTWAIFTIIAGIAAAVQFAEDAGPGKWVMALNTFMCLTIVLLSLRYGEKDIRRSDGVSLALALTIIPVWLLTNNPLWAVLMAMGIELFACYPTLRKSWSKPHEEVAQTWFLSSFMFIVSVMALEQISFVTAAYPLFVAMINFLVFFILLWRRRVMAARPGGAQT